jgi:hypothetical protein
MVIPAKATWSAQVDNKRAWGTSIKNQAGGNGQQRTCHLTQMKIAVKRAPQKLLAIRRKRTRHINTPLVTLLEAYWCSLVSLILRKNRSPRTHVSWQSRPHQRVSTAQLSPSHHTKSGVTTSFCMCWDFQSPTRDITHSSQYAVRWAVNAFQACTPPPLGTQFPR